MANSQPCVEVMWNGSEYSKCLAMAMFDSKSKGFLVDITLESSGQKLSAHKIVLSSASAYFQELFAGSPHLTSTTVDLPFNILETLVQYCYLGEIKIPALLVTSCIQAGKRLGIKGFGEFSSPDELQPSRMRTLENIAHPSSRGDINDSQPPRTIDTRPCRRVASIPESITKVVLPNGISVDNIYDPIIKLSRIVHVPNGKGPSAKSRGNSSSSSEMPACSKPKRQQDVEKTSKSGTVERKTRSKSAKSLTRISSPVSTLLQCNTDVEMSVQENPETRQDVSQLVRQNGKEAAEDTRSDPDGENFLGWNGSEGLENDRCFLRPFSKLTCRACDEPFGYMQTYIEHLSWCSEKCTNLLCPRCDLHFPKLWGVTHLESHLISCLSREPVISSTELGSKPSGGLSITGLNSKPVSSK